MAGTLDHLECAVAKRRSARTDQIASTTPNGQALDRKPYALDNTQPTANATMKSRLRDSKAYINIMNVSATTPNAVIQVTTRL